MPGQQLLALDVGQSGTALAVDGVRQEALLPALRGAAPIAEQLADLVRHALDLVDGGPVTVAIGSTGADSLTLAAEMRPRLPGTVATVLVAHDSVTSYLGCRGVEPGCVLAVGTGTVALAVGTAVARVDGWGSLVGDAGSGYWIGRAAIDAALRAEDGRGRRTALRERVAERFGGLDSLGVRLQADPDRVRRIAGCARDVAAMAESDDEAARITDDAGAELARTVQAACRRAGPGSQAAVVTTGNALAAPGLSAALVRHLARLVPDAHRTAPVGDGLDGAGLLPSVPDTFPLHALVSRA